MRVLERILVSVSGGRSSMKMAKLIRDEWCPDKKHRDMLRFLFANTGKEREETLIFLDRCDREWGLGVVWLEAVTHMEEGIACTHRVVDFASASRNGEPFEQMIQKYGIPNMNYLHCTRELKANAMRSYMRSIGWNEYLIAQGIRLDEPKRSKPKDGVIYPLVHVWPMTKPEILDWWKEQSFDLKLKDYQGNCDACHKKHLPKLVRIAQEDEHIFDWWSEMEGKYGLAGHNEDGTPRTFFRGHRTAQDIVAMSKILAVPPQRELYEEEDAGCSESCEAFA
jgi:Phosphoadenosine phosphosulfate reductase family